MDLSISRKIIQDHGGRLWLESREGGYTKAIVELPAAMKDEMINHFQKELFDKFVVLFA